MDLIETILPTLKRLKITQNSNPNSSEITNPQPIPFSSTFFALRKKLIECVICIHSKLSSSPATLWLAVFLSERYICEKDVNSDMLELIAVASLLIASRVHDASPIPDRTFAYQTKGLYTRLEINEFSNELFFGHPIDSSITTPLQEIDRYLQYMSSHHRILAILEKYDVSIDVIRCLAYFHAERNLYDPMVAWKLPNVFAISSIRTAILSAFLNHHPSTPSVRSPSNSVDGTTEAMLLASSSQDEYQSDFDFIPLSDPPISRSTSFSDSSSLSGTAADQDDQKKRCLQEIIEILFEISGENPKIIQETSLLIAKNVNSDFYLTLHPSSPQFDPTFLLPTTTPNKKSKKCGSPDPSPRQISASRSLSDTHLPTFELSSLDPSTHRAGSVASNPPLTMPSRKRSTSNGFIYGLKACQSILREKYSQSKYHRVSDVVIPLFDKLSGSGT